MFLVLFQTMEHQHTRNKLVETLPPAHLTITQQQVP